MPVQIIILTLKKVGQAIWVVVYRVSKYVITGWLTVKDSLEFFCLSGRWLFDDLLSWECFRGEDLSDSFLASVEWSKGDLDPYLRESPEGSKCQQSLLGRSQLSFADGDFNDLQWSNKERSYANSVRIIGVEVLSKYFGRWSANYLSLSFRTISVIGNMKIVFDWTDLRICSTFCSRMYDTDQLHFVKDDTSTGMKGSCQGVFEDIVHHRLESLIRVQTICLYYVLKHAAMVWTNSALIMSCILAMPDWKISVTSDLVTTQRSANPVTIWLWGSVAIVSWRIPTSSRTAPLPRDLYRRFGFTKPSGRRLRLTSCCGTQR